MAIPRTIIIYICEKVIKLLKEEDMLSKKGLNMSYADVENIGIDIWKNHQIENYEFKDNNNNNGDNKK